MFVVKVYSKIEISPWALALTGPVPEAFELPASGAGQSAKRSSQETRVFLHDVVFLIDRHNCIAFSTGTALEQNVNNLEKLQALAGLQETNALR